MDVYRKALKDFSGKEIYDLDDLDVLDFLMYKDVNDSGRTIIHHHTYPNVGNSSVETCPDLVKCSYRHSANSMRVGIVLKLLKLFRRWEEEVFLRKIPCLKILLNSLLFRSKDFLVIQKGSTYNV